MPATEPVFRVEHYRLSAGDFPGKSYRLHLRYTLATNYFVMVQWQVASGGPIPPAELCVRVTEDPYGTGELAQAGGNWLTLFRENAVAGAADLVVTVVECLTDESGAGFKLLDVQATTLPAVGAGVQTVTDTSAVTWTDASRVVLFGGYRGGGLSSTGNFGDQVQTAGVRCYPSGTGTLNFQRYGSGATKLQAAVITTYVVEFGFEWTVQRVTVTGTNTGATLDNTAHYSTQALGYNVARAQTWVWACGYTDGSGPGDGPLGQVYTLGDGVASNVTESVVAVGGASAITQRSFEVYVLTHTKLSAAYSFHAMAVGAASFTVTAPATGTESYLVADTLYAPTTAGQRLAAMSQGMNNNVVNDLGEILYAVAPTAGTTVSATIDDPAPTVPWAGWLQVVDFAGIVVNADSLPAIRVTTYRISGTTWAAGAATHDLALAYPLSSNYFVMIEGGDSSGVAPDPDDCAAYVSQDPNGTGDLAPSSGSRVLRLARTASAQPWRGQVTVVECLRGEQTVGFKLVDVRSIALPAFADTGVQTINGTLTAGVKWTDPSKVVVFAGWRGGGIQTVGAHVAGDIQSLGVAVSPRGTNSIQLQRYTNSNTRCKAVNVVCYAVEWGSEWTVQRIDASASAGGTDVNATAEYQTFLLDTAVKPTQSWVWASVTAEDDETFHSFLSASVALGDGVAFGTEENRVAIGLWAADAFLASVYVLTHPSLTTGWSFQPTGTLGSVNLVVASPLRGEQYNKVTYDYTVGFRMGVAYTAISDGALTNIAAAALYPRHTAPTTLNLARDRTEGNWAGWAQSVDFGSLFLSTSAIQIDDSSYPSPQAYLILQDPQWDGSANVVSATSQGGRQAGPVDPDNTNGGVVVGFQDGTPNADTEFDYHLFAGAVGGSGGWLYRLATETTAADWKAINALTTLWRQNSWTSIGDPPTQQLHAQDIAYSAAYQRLVGAWIHTDGTVRIERQDAGDIFGSWTSGTIGMAGFGADTGKETGVGICELVDGTMLCVYQQEDSATGFLNISAFNSTDGGSTWNVVQQRILTRTSAGSMGSSGGQYLVRSSGDWVRVVWNSSNVGATGIASAVQKTIVSPDRGASWSYLSTFTTYPWKSPFGYAGSAPSAMCGVGDASGTFLLAYLGSIGSSTVKIAVAARDDDWENVAALDFDCSSYATTARVKGLCLVRDPDRIWLFVWVEGTDKSEIIARVCTDPTDPENSANWKTLGQISGLGGVMRYGPHCWRGVWAGNRLVLSAGLQDPDVAATADPAVAGHWMVQSGAWDVRPWDYTNLDPIYNDYLVDGARLVEYQWLPCTGDPAGGGADSDGLTPWTKTTAGVTTTTWSKNRVRLTTTDATGVCRYNLPLSVPSANNRWGGGYRGFCWHVGVKSVNSRVATTAGEDTGIRVQALDSTGAAGYDFTLRISPTAVTLYDNFGAAAKVTQATTDFAEDTEVRIAIKGSAVGFAWRKKSAGPLAAWTVLGDYTMANAALAAQEFRMGILAAPGAGTSTIELFDFAVSYQTDAGQRTDVVKPTNLMGTKLNRGPILVKNGVRVRWGGSGAYQGDGFTGKIEFTRGVRNFDLDSPRYFWESTDLAENAIVYVSDSRSSGPRWHIDAWMLVGTVDRTARLQFSNTNSAAAWLAPAVDVELSADLYTDLTVVAIDGSSLQLQAPSGTTFAPRRGEVQQYYLRFVAAGAATGVTVRIRNDVHTSTWWHIDDGLDLATLGIPIGAKAVVYGDRMLYLGASFVRYQYARVVFPDLSAVAGSRGTYTGTHRLGGLVPGFKQRFTVPLEWSFVDNEQPNITELRTKGGASWHYEEGPPQRVVEGRCVGDVDEFRRSLRDMLAKVHGFSVRPIGLLLDSGNVTPDTLLYGRISSGSQMDEAAWYKDTNGIWRTAGDVDVTFTEEP